MVDIETQTISQMPSYITLIINNEHQQIAILKLIFLKIDFKSCFYVRMLH